MISGELTASESGGCVFLETPDEDPTRFLRKLRNLNHPQFRPSVSCIPVSCHDNRACQWDGHPRLAGSLYSCVSSCVGAMLLRSIQERTTSRDCSRHVGHAWKRVSTSGLAHPAQSTVLPCAMRWSLRVKDHWHQRQAPPPSPCQKNGSFAHTLRKRKQTAN
eukprot:2305893-Rhodomonas_salina.3